MRKNNTMVIVLARRRTHPRVGREVLAFMARRAALGSL